MKRSRIVILLMAVASLLAMLKVFGSRETVELTKMNVGSIDKTSKTSTKDPTQGTVLGDSSQSENRPDTIDSKVSEPLVKLEGTLRKPSEAYEQFLDLLDKPLVSENDKSAFLSIIDDPGLVEFSEKVLTRSEFGELNLSKERERLDAISYVGTLLSKKFPVKDDIEARAIEVVKTVLYRESIQGQQSEDLKKSLIGDKVELGVVLAVHWPNEWKEIVQTKKIPERLIEHITFYSDRHNLLMRENVGAIVKKLKSGA
ncbi:hypothetical protein [Pseudobacteriovorax antillogorgiicola]|uniref:Uncharacterized protein n=1 Tax=Pseudobacteriovorax antillogorgiicola TaxID=1513793 RepID=A0A1Y6CJ20_9BACT|nr:hypothetical protein [Pseudobacteriovorax antillogorgiicola]TCS46428.1 hypothetical protein EDD56_12492 [Pseudobacteriovorax antillogorgiicola]SMF69028.1 hypothetical protein SAMN06296036_12492 [Pseudobacteriovorax antillogorgiicola]